jgi:hypothetical protein
MKKILGVLLSFILLIAIGSTPNLAADSKGLKIGDKLKINGVDTTFLGRQSNGDYKWKATFSAPDVNCSWVYDAGKKEFTLSGNLFTASVRGTAVTVTYQGKNLSWNPDISIGSKQDKAFMADAFLLPTDPINSNYWQNTLCWTYSGFNRYLRVIEGMLIEYYVLESAPTGDISIKLGKLQDAGFTGIRPSAAWDADNKPVKLDTGKDSKGELVLTLANLKDAKYPVTIDPDVDFTTSASDGYLQNSNFWQLGAAASWSGAHDAATATSVGATAAIIWAWLDANYSSGINYWSTTIRRSYLYFNTSGLPDSCTITDAYLNLYVQAKYTTLGNSDIIIQSGMVAGENHYPHDPLAAADYSSGYYTNDCGQLGLGAITASQYNEWTLNATGESIISKTGTTKLVIRQESFDEDNVQPNYADGWLGYSSGISFYAYEQGDGYRPFFEVTYTSSAAPTITANAESNLAMTSARFNGTIDDDGGMDDEVRWGYGTTTQLAANFAAYDTNTAWVAGYNSGDFPFYDTGAILVANTGYYYRFQAKNDTGTTTSDEIHFHTLNSVVDPTNFKAIPSDTTVSLSWTRGAGTTISVIRVAYDDFPATSAAGFAVYNLGSSTYTHTGLTPGKTYYYAVWGQSGANESTNPAEVMVTTLAAGTGGDALTDPLQPMRWLSAPNYTNLHELPIMYDAINNMADAMDMPRANFWMLGALLCSCVVGVVLFRTGFLFAFIGLLVSLIGGWAIQIIPFWIPLLVLIIGVAVFMTNKEVGER